MSRGVFSLILVVAVAVVPTFGIAQQDRSSTSVVGSSVFSEISMFSYKEGRKSDLDFRSTPVAPDGTGKAEVEYEKGNARIEAKIKKLPDPPSLGPYTTYVLWALTPDGRAANQGVFDDSLKGKGKLETTYPASQFALIVTAEPHFAVTAPSSMVVLYNVADKVKGSESKVTSLRESADYSDLTPIEIDKSNPADLVQAKYALAIATAAGAADYAVREYQVAQEKLAAAEAAYGAEKYSVRKSGPAVAREATLAGEDARRAGMAGKAAAETAAAAAAGERARSEALADEAAQQDLLNRLNAALPTRATDRGLVSEIGDVDFGTGTSNLDAQARESLARFAGVVASYPTLNYGIEGHTDITGSEEKNRELSLKRAIAVRDYLIGQGVPASRMDVAGLGSSRPVASNETAEGRARNRRVEIVVSGGPLGD
jgi:outer membrane protein OmpA-like peptidoglycan-associated protein